MKSSIILTVGALSISVQFKPIRHMYLRVRDNSENGESNIHISAPLHTSPETLKRFIDSRKDWIENQRQRLAQREIPSGYVLHLGKLIERDAFVDELCGLANAPEQQKQRAARGRTAVWQQYRRTVLHDLLKSYLEEWQARLGLHAESWHVRRMKSRWGSCQVLKKRLCFNAELVAHTPECIEYVVVHELVHLVERGHGPAFWRRVEEALPDWEHRRRQLNGRTTVQGGN